MRLKLLMPGEKLSPGIAIRVQADLPASATTTAGTTAATEATTAATEATTCVSTAAIGPYRPATAVSNAAVTAAVSISAPPVEAAAIATESITTAEPGTSSDKEAASEIVRPVVTVRSTSVGVIPVVAVLTSRRPISRIGRGITDANPDTNLSLRGLNAHRKKQNQKKAK
jgi:hypothetical protein